MTTRPARRRPGPAPSSRGRWRGPFLAVLADGLTVRDACRAAGVARSAAYRRRAADPAFAAAWAGALAAGADALAEEVRRRGVEGVRRPVLYLGEVVFVWQTPDGSVTLPNAAGAELLPLYETTYSDALLMFLMKQRDPSYRESYKVGIGGDPDAPPVAVKAFDVFERIRELTGLPADA